MKKVLALALALVLTLAVSVSLADQSFMLDLATAYAADAPAGIALQKFVDDVNEKSGGSIDISLFTDGTLGNTTDNYASVASGDRFVESKADKDALRALSCDICDMEIAAIARICALNDVPCLSVKCISDTYDGTSADFEQNVTRSAEKAFYALRCILEHIS